MDRNLLFVPDISSGSGHLLRCLRLQAELGGKILLHEPVIHNPYQPLLNYSDLAEKRAVFILDRGQKLNYHTVIFDYRELSKEFFFRISSILSIGLDTGGAARSCCTYLIDTLPAVFRFRNKCAPNVQDRGFLEAPQQIRPQWPEKIHSILIFFGGSNRDNRAEKLANALHAESSSPLHIEIGQGIFSKELETDMFIEQAYRSGEDLREKLHAFDLLITHIGMLAYEALWTRVPVLLLNPTSYHDKLSIHEVLPTVRQSWKRSPEVLARAILSRIQNPDMIIQRSISSRPLAVKNLSEHLAQCIDNYAGSSLRQPCDPPQARFSDRSYFYSPRWRIGYMARCAAQSIHYTEDYFFKQYKEQYGRTYLEDAQTIRKLSAQRMQRIQKLSPSGRNLLDIGCAYGMFLQEASEWGYSVEGLDISADAVEYVTGVLGLPAQRGDVQSSDFVQQYRGKCFGVLTMWYVLEHCSDLRSVLSFLSAIILPGGILAISLPNASGISARKNRNAFLRESPADHFHFFSYSNVKHIFSEYGYHLCKRVCTGHHPERFPLCGNVPALQPVLSRISRILSLGDTLEVYFRYTGGRST